MTTMNLRLGSYGSKSLKKQKNPENLPPFPIKYQDSCSSCTEETKSLLEKIATETSFDFQIQHLRETIRILGEENHKESCFQVNSVVFWFFQLPSSSSLRPIIASSLNKVSKDEDFSHVFEIQIREMIASSDQELPLKVSYCFDNCFPALKAVKGNVQDLYRVFLLHDIEDVSRVALSLETIEHYTGNELLEKVLEKFEDDEIQGEIKSNLALIWAHELNSKYDNFALKVVKNLQEEETELKKFLPRSSNSIWLIHLVQAVIIISGPELLENGIIGSFFDVINNVEERDANVAYIKSLATLQCVSKHLSLCKKGHNQISKSHENGQLLKKYETYALTNLSYSIDRIRYNAKHTLEKLVELFNLCQMTQELGAMIQNILSLPWECKTKSVALSSIAKTNMDILLEQCPNLSLMVAKLMQDPTIESVAADLYENLMKNTDAKNETWIKVWIEPLLSEIEYESISAMRLLKTALKLNGDRVLQCIISKQKPDLSLVCLKMDRVGGGQFWKKHFEDVILPSLEHFEDFVRISALDLIVSSHSSREDFREEDLESLFWGIRLTLVIQRSSDRQQMITVMKKMALRLKNAKNVNLAFVRKLFLFFSDECLGENVSFSRRSIALECLNELVFHFSDSLKDLKSQDRCQIIQSCLHDSFEQNKKLASEILAKFPPPANQEDLLQNSLTLTRSQKPPDSISAGYFFKYLSLTKKDLIYTLLEELNQQVKMAKANLGIAAMKSPMYSVLYCIRSILKEPEETIVQKLLEIGQKISKIVAPIVCSDSPEGQVLMDSDVSAQILLLCSWRTSKEISLLFGQLCPFLQAKDLDLLSDYFTSQLADIKHRGAFEQAFAGFCTLCSFMWKSQSHQGTPERMLQMTLDQLTEDGGSKFCATRRSAGMPYLIQAVVSTEPLANNYASLKLALAKLKECCRDPRMDVRIHAFNILRILFRDSTLGEVVSPFISDGLKAAILGFKASVWSERNSATLLFSSLCTRIFGVKRSKADLSKRNAMSARMFFSRFPDLYNFLLEEINTVASIIERSPSKVSPEESSVYPVLLILAKLHPYKSVEKSEEQYQLFDFVQPLDKCLGSAILKMRELASLALANILHRSGIGFEVFFNMWIVPDQAVTHNKCHGRILLLQRMVQMWLDEDSQNSVFADEIRPFEGQLKSIFAYILHATNCNVLKASLCSVILTLKRQCGLSLDGFDNFNGVIQGQCDAKSLVWKPCFDQSLWELPLTNDVIMNTSKDSRLAFYENSDLNFDYDVMVAKLFSETNASCQEALMRLVSKKVEKEGFPPASKRNLISEVELRVVELTMTKTEFMNVSPRLRGLFIHFSGAILAHYFHQLSTEVVHNWLANIVELMEESEDDPELKLCIASIMTSPALMRLMRAENMQPSTSLEAFQNALTYASLWFITDDDYDVRKLAMEAQGKTKASSLLFAELLQDLKRRNQGFVAAFFHHKMAQKLDCQDGIEDSESSAFDKSETNAWREEKYLMKAIEDLKLAPSDLNLTFHEDDVFWLRKKN